VVCPDYRIILKWVLKELYETVDSIWPAKDRLQQGARLKTSMSFSIP
jgi:hypothetical protein